MFTLATLTNEVHKKDTQTFFNTHCQTKFNIQQQQQKFPTLQGNETQLWGGGPISVF